MMLHGSIHLLLPRGPARRERTRRKARRATRLWAAGCAFAASAVFGEPHALAYNHDTHQDIVDIAWQMMRVVQTEQRLIALLDSSPAPFSTTPPADATQAEWDAFLQAVKNAPPAIEALDAGLPPPAPSPFECGVGTCQGTLAGLDFAPKTGFMDSDANCDLVKAYDPGGLYHLLEQVPGASNVNVGKALGLHAARVDDEIDDTHIWLRPQHSSVLFPGSSTVDGLRRKVHEAAPTLRDSILIAVVCGVEMLVGLGSDCASHAKDLGNVFDKVPSPEALEGMIPGVADISNGDTTTVWHFINVESCASNTYDDNQGLFYEEGGPNCTAAAVDLAIMLGIGDGLGASLNYSKSNGTRRFRFVEDGDGHTGKGRSPGEWQSPTLAHLAFNPLDNLAFYGWDNFRRERSAKWLAWPLHALGDATVPMHVVGTSGHGHRPYEDAVSQRWEDIRQAPEFEQTRRVLQGAFRFRKMVLDWRATHPGRSVAGDLPIRDLVVAVARSTRDRARAAGDVIFNDPASTTYLTESKPAAVSAYAPFLDFQRGQIELGMSAILAFLTSASELPAVTPPDPGPPPPACQVTCLAQNKLCGASNSVPGTSCCGPFVCLRQDDGRSHCVPDTTVPPDCIAQGASCAGFGAPCCGGLSCGQFQDDLESTCQPSCGAAGATCRELSDCCIIGSSCQLGIDGRKTCVSPPPR